jgi:hypothetical protein
VAEKLVELLTEETPTLIGIDHGFSFPLRYFESLSPRSPMKTALTHSNSQNGAMRKQRGILAVTKRKLSAGLPHLCASCVH